ncbi:MAG: cation diffusion facilitator family transporter [Anaerolineae bacterium]|nr:MAG: cation diffusion facilitator family transporter [Anaerolineae bacterium]
MQSIGPGLGIAGSAMAINLVLALVKISTGVIGNSYALIADGIESTSDIFSSLIVLSGLQFSSKPADQSHPYGHGKAESLAGMAVALFLIGAGVLIAVQAIREILTPQQSPAWFTLPILAIIIVVKEALYRRMYSVGSDLDSNSLRSDAWHHRSDAITSLAAFVGISIALIGGTGYESADDWAALLAVAIIFANGVRLLRPALDEVMDASVSDDIEQQVVSIASSVEGVVTIEKFRIRKSGLGYLMDLHVQVDSAISVKNGHAIGHMVNDRLMESSIPITDVVIHIEPARDGH